MVPKNEIKCAICGPAASYSVLYPERISKKNIDFTSRKVPEKTHYRIVKCDKCGLTYSNPIFSDEYINQLYRESEFIEEPQLENMVNDYKAELKEILPFVKNKQRLLDIGCANGFFLKAALELGFEEVWGVEPNEEAIKKADPEIRPKIINAVFSEDLFEPEFFDVVCFFHLFDHLTNPNEFLKNVHRVLRKDGLLLAMNHDSRSLTAKIFGEYSPIFDIEHIFLFDKKTMRMILEKNGFRIIDVKDIKNNFTIGHSLKIFPWPKGLKWIRRLIPRIPTKLANQNIKVGWWNILSIAKKF